MPAVSKKQAVAMNIAKAVQAGKATAKPGSPSAQIAASMPPAAMNEFAGTPQQGLPAQAPKPKRMSVKNVGQPVTQKPF